MNLNINFVRSQFEQISHYPNFVFCSNAGGSYVANQVNHLFNYYNSHTRVQPYERYTPSVDAGQAMDRALQSWAEALNIATDELTIGPSTSINTYIMAQAIGAQLKKGDEIIVTNQDHEANSGVWRKKAEEKNITLKEWRVDPGTGLLDPEALYPLLTDKTKWVFFTHCSNIVGNVNPVKAITTKVKENSSAHVFVDAVAYAPHCISDLKELEVDGYTFSLYKVFGPHQSLLYVKSEVAERLTPQCHYFNTEQKTKWFSPTGPQHAQVAACAGVMDYFDDLYQHHFTDTKTSRLKKMSVLHDLISRHENNLTQAILDCLSNKRNIRIIGKTHTHDNDRASTIAFKPLNESSFALSSRIQDYGIGCESGHFYAHRLIQDLGLDPDDGVVRISLVHYSTHQDVTKIINALDQSIQ